MMVQFGSMNRALRALEIARRIGYKGYVTNQGLPRNQWAAVIGELER